MTISLTALKSARTGMTESENWIHDEGDYRSVEIIGQDFGMRMDNSCDARGVVATVRAAPVLIEVVEAALAWGAAVEAAARYALAAQRGEAVIIGPGLAEDHARTGKALLAALAKVSP